MSYGAFIAVFAFGGFMSIGLPDLISFCLWGIE
jgi:hypothetical protein